MIKIHENIIAFSSVDFQNIEELDAKIKDNVQRIDNGTKCIICERIFRTTAHLAHAKEHVEGAHIQGLQFPCNLCDKISRNRKALRTHKNNYHKGHSLTSKRMLSHGFEFDARVAIIQTWYWIA